jgi:hypothetical protein
VALTDQEVRDILARASEIQHSLRSGPELDRDLAAIVAAGEEVGLSRAALERAIRERLDLPLEPPAVGSLVFARSANDKYYAAQVLALVPDGVRVRFLRGSEQLVAADQVRPAALNPGEKVMVEWPWWGPWNCTVIGYDAPRQRVKVSDGWGYTRTFPVAEVWLAPGRKGDLARSTRRKVIAALLGAGVVLGALGAMLVSLLFP